jgi:hypothetical protein
LIKAAGHNTMMTLPWPFRIQEHDKGSLHMGLNKLARILILACAMFVIVPAYAQTSDTGTGETRVRFTVGDAEIMVRITDNPTSRDFLSMLPLTLNFRDFNAMEKISDLPRRLTIEGSSGRAPVNGDLIYFVPWGNLGFFYESARRDTSFDDRVIPIGAIESGYERLEELEKGPARVERVP